MRARASSEFIKGNAAIYAGQGENANDSYKYFGSALNRAGAFVGELNADQRLFSRFIVSSGKLATAVAGRGEELSSAICNANTAFDAIASQNVAFDASLRRLPPVFRQANTTFVNLRAALDDVEPLINTAKPATKDLAPFLAELRPVLRKLVPFTRNLRLTVSRPGKANDTAELLAVLPTVQQRASSAFPHSEDAIAAFQPNLNFIRAYTPDLFNGFAKLGQVAGYYDGNGHYVRVGLREPEPLQLQAAAASWNRSRQGEQYERFGGSAASQPPLPRRRHPARRRRLQPLRRTARRGSGVDTSECNPADAPPGP